MSTSDVHRVDQPTRSRGRATKERLIRAATELFGLRGFDGVGARELAAAADAPLAAIPYHFGTKEALYCASLERVRDEMTNALLPAIKAAHSAIENTPDGARAALSEFQQALLGVFVADARAETWAKLLLREHLDPSPSFDVVYRDAGLGAVELMAQLIARSSGRLPTEEAVVIEAFARMGEVLIFRTTQYAALKKLGWTRMGSEETARLGAVLATLRP